MDSKRHQCEPLQHPSVVEVIHVAKQTVNTSFLPLLLPPKTAMWSMEFSGRVSALNAQQRILYPVENHSETTKKQLGKLLLFGICAGLAILSPDDPAVLHTVQLALQSVCAKNPLLSRSQFAIVVETGPQWGADRLQDRVEHLLKHLQLKTVDVLLLRAQTLSIPEGSDIYERKRATLRYWQQMVAIQQAGLVSQIGVSEFTIQQVEFILTAYPTNPPVALSLTASLGPSSSTELRLAAMLSFAHGRGMDVVLRFPFRSLDTMSLVARDRWKRLAHTIAQTHREQTFHVAITHEADKEPFQMQQRSMSETSALQSPLQIVMRYLLQKGVVVIPLASESGHGVVNMENLDDEECQALFYALLHPFTSLAPSYSANALHSSLLSQADLIAIDHALHIGYRAPSAS